MKKKVCQYLSKVLVEMSEEELMKTMEIPPEEKMGDLALPCFAMAKKMRKNPMQITAELVEKLNEQKDELGIEKVESVGAYCNIHLKRDLFVEKCLESLQKDKYGVSQTAPKGKFCFMPASFMKCVFSQSLLIFWQVIHNARLQYDYDFNFFLLFSHFLLAGITFFATIISVQD